jgi:hypothetical protein
MILRQRFPSHPLWMDPLWTNPPFNSEEYRIFAARVEDSLVDVVTPDELTMQNYWPAHDAMTKLRHEAGVSKIVRSIIDRLYKMERSRRRRRLRPRESRSGLFKVPCWSSQLRLSLSFTWDILQRRRRRVINDMAVGRRQYGER